jgi:hypothetical protein
MVNKVVMCLGTNDVSKCKDDSDQVNVLLTQAIAKVKSHFPDSLIGICGIFPRKGTGNNTNILKILKLPCQCIDQCCLELRPI